MQPHIEPTEYTNFNSGRGGRVSSESYRHSLTLCDEFEGLEEGVSRYDLLLLVKKVGQLAGFTPRMIALLDYLIAYTRDCDWEEGGRPIVYQSLSRTALDLGVSERQIQKLEQRLFEIGAISWNDSGNHRRYGQRDADTGRILYAYGVDLTPLAYLRDELEQKLHAKRLYDDAWMATKREISWHRRQVRAMLLEMEQEEGGCATRGFNARYDEIAMQLRTHLSLETLRSLLDRHISLYSDLLARLGGNGADGEKTSERASIPQETTNRSCRSEQEFAHYKYSNQRSSNSGSRNDAGFQESVAEPPAPEDAALSAGLPHVSFGMASEAASQRFAEQVPAGGGWPGLVEAACHVRRDLGVSQQSWAEACELLGRNGAALCVLVTDRALDRDENRVRAPAAYFRAMVKRARDGKLSLHSSVFGLLGEARQCN